MKIGMIVAIADEINAMLTEIGTPIKQETVCGVKVREYEVEGNELYVAQSGAGEIYAAGATQLLISEYGAEMIVNFGICGGLTKEMSACSTVVVEKVVHYDFDTSAIDNCEVGRYIEYPDVYIPASKKLIDIALSAEPSLKAVICASADKFVDASEKVGAELALRRVNLRNGVGGNTFNGKSLPGSRASYKSGVRQRRGRSGRVCGNGRKSGSRLHKNYV